MFDTINATINYFGSLRSRILSAVSTMEMRFLLTLKGIKVGRGSRFFGNATFRRSRNSHIVIGDNCVFRSWATSNLIGINRPCILSAIGENSKIEIGDNCGFSGTVIGCFSSITIGNNVRCGSNTLITDGNWHSDDPRSGISEPIIISDGVWLGVNVTVLKGVTIGINSVVGAGSVVTKSIPDNVVAAGNPCKVIKTFGA